MRIETTSLRPLTAADARAIATWRYDGPYAVYNLPPDADLAPFLDPANGYVAVEDERGELVGYLCAGPDAPVPGGVAAGLYGGAALDVGIGLRPDLTGRGLGGAFLAAGLDYARARYGPVALRLSVAAFNSRAIRVYERAGFVAVATFTSPLLGCDEPFLLMVRPAPAQ